MIFIKDVVWTHVLPFICSFGLLTNFINFYVFSERRRMGIRNRIHQYFQIDSIAEFTYLLICLIYFILKSKHLSFIHFSYPVAFYEKYLYFYFASVLGFFMIFLRLFVSIRRLMIVLNKFFFLQSIQLYKIVAFFFLLSLVLNIQCVLEMFITENRIKIGNQTVTVQYITHQPQFNDSKLLYTFGFVVFSTRGFLAPVILLIVNFLIIRIMKNALLKKMHIKSKFYHIMFNLNDS